MKVRMKKGVAPIYAPGGIEKVPAHPEYWEVADAGLPALKPLIDAGLLEVLQPNKSKR